ncbi:FAD-dependent oxidoreductase [Christiangramia aquimixticola]|uniref:FAD-dependent oxidoreductase n=1 Tax=Christiangramia aquimixticola TaxID=1697558 RepID=UPI003AA7AABB
MKSVTVIGCGIIGLTTAIKLQEKGFRVTIIAKEPFDRTLSSKVGAIWFPFEIQPKERANKWSALTYQEYQLDKNEGNGVSFIPFITAYNNTSNTDWIKLLPSGTVRKALPEELPKGIDAAHISIVPLAEPHLYLPYLFNRFVDNGGIFKMQKIASLKEASTLNSLVINCTGLGAKDLCNDENLQPMRGQILRCKKMDISSCADSTKKGALSYVINRSEDCIIGGTDYENDWNTNVEINDTNLIIDRLIQAGLSKESPEIIEEMVGLRPKRSCVRFDFDEKYTNVFHNYGHGGAGFTVAWGCAIELAEMVDLKLK